MASVDEIPEENWVKPGQPQFLPPSEHPGLVHVRLEAATVGGQWLVRGFLLGEEEPRGQSVHTDQLTAAMEVLRQIGVLDPESAAEQWQRETAHVTWLSMDD